MTTRTRLDCECESPQLTLDADRTVHCHKCGKPVVDSQVAQAVRLVQVALGNGVGLDEATLDALADRVAKRLQGQPASPAVDAVDTLAGLIGPDELARRLGRTREWAYDHAKELGVIRLGEGPRPRLWFDWAEVERRLSRSGSPEAQRERKRKA